MPKIRWESGAQCWVVNALGTKKQYLAWFPAIEEAKAWCDGWNDAARVQRLRDQGILGNTLAFHPDAFVTDFATPEQQATINAKTRKRQCPN